MCQKLYMCGVCQNTVGEVNNYKSSETLFPVWIVHEIDAVQSMYLGKKLLIKLLEIGTYLFFDQLNQGRQG